MGLAMPELNRRQIFRFDVGRVARGCRVAGRCSRFFSRIVIKQTPYNFFLAPSAPRRILVVFFKLLVLQPLLIGFTTREHQRHRALLALLRLPANCAGTALYPDVQPGQSHEHNDGEKKCRHLRDRPTRD